MRTINLSTAVVLALTACACGGASDPDHDPAPNPGSTGDVVQSPLSRDTSPEVPASDAAQLASDGNAFACDVYQALGKSAMFDGENLFFSPLSISTALAMAYAGAEGETAAQMASALRFTLPPARLHPAMNQLDLALSSRGQGAKAADGKAFRLRVSNSLWGQSGLPFETPFLDTLAVNYGAGIRTVDFMNAPDDALGSINRWVSLETEARIDPLLAEGSITPDVRLVLVNAVYFNAAWQTPFEESSTAPAAFTGLDGTSTEVPMMHGFLEGAPYLDGDGFQMVALPYDGGEVEMEILVPDAGRFDEVESKITGDWLAERRTERESKPGSIKMPRFEIKGETFSVRPVLEALGMHKAFTESAELEGITRADDLMIYDVAHQAFVKVNEAGTEAAAATAVIVGTTSVQPDPFDLTIDRPFLFTIRDIPTGAVVFLGRVAAP